MIQIAEERLNGERPAELAIMEAEAGEDVDWVRDMVVKRLRPERMYVRILTPVVGTHGGPGTIGLAFHTLT